MSEARNRIDNQQDLLAVVAKVFGDRHRGFRGKPAHHGALVAGRDDRDGGRDPRQGIAKKFPHFAAALADKRNDDGVDPRSPGQHGQQGGFAHPRAGEDADALTGAERSEEVDDTNAGASGE